MLKGSQPRYGRVGDVIVASVKVATPNIPASRRATSSRPSSSAHAGVRRAAPMARTLKFDDNACVVINPANLEPRGTRIFGPVARECATSDS